ncbi:MAG: hypothetical protein WC648_02750 [Candidatus Paceibacterota bacterium]|jgi:hypothetical protein
MKVTRLIHGHRISPFASTDWWVLRAANFAIDHAGLLFVGACGCYVVIYSNAHPDEQTIESWFPAGDYHPWGNVTVQKFDNAPVGLDVGAISKWLDEQ